MDIKTISLPLPSDEYDHTDQQVTRRITEQAIETISSRLNSIEKLDSNQLSNAIRKKQFLLMGATEQASKLTTTAEIADGAVTSAKLDTNITVSGTLDSTGKLTADAGIDVDNFNIDGTTIALSSGNMTIDVAGNINLDADGGEVAFKDGGTAFLEIANSSSDAVIRSTVQDKDILFNGNDGGSAITALTLDMSSGGDATFNGTIAAADGSASAPSVRGTDTNTGLFFPSGGVTAISRNGVEAMRINSSGHTITGGTSAVGSSTVSAYSVGTSNGFGAKVGNELWFNFVGNNTSDVSTFYVKSNGDYHFAGSDVSDKDLKENITDVPDGSLALVKQLKPRTFNFKASEGFEDSSRTGFIAQEVASVMTTNHSVATGTDGQKDMGVNPMGLIAHLTKAIQELEARLKILEDA